MYGVAGVVLVVPDGAAGGSGRGTRQRAGRRAGTGDKSNRHPFCRSPDAKGIDDGTGFHVPPRKRLRHKRRPHQP